MFEIITKKQLGAKISYMVISAPLVAARAMPGQFLIVRADIDGERIPLTICDFDREKGLVTIVFQAVGAETERMSRLEAGDCFADVVGPLGNPSDLCDTPISELKKKNILFIAGGVGGGCKALYQRTGKPAYNVITIDEIAATVEYMNKGIITAAICQEPRRQGAIALTIVLDAIAKKDAPTSEYNYTDINIKIKENI